MNYITITYFLNMWSLDRCLRRRIFWHVHIMKIIKINFKCLSCNENICIYGYYKMQWAAICVHIYSITHRLKSKLRFSINTQIHLQSPQTRRRQKRRKSKNQRKNQKISLENQKVGENVDAEEEKLLTSRQLMMKIQT